MTAPLALPAQAVGAVPTIVCTFLCAFSVLPLETEVTAMQRTCNRQVAHMSLPLEKEVTAM